LRWPEADGFFERRLGDRLDVLVTGGAGFIGSHACKRLAAGGFRPVVLDDLSRSHRDAVKWGPLETGSTGDRNRVTEILDKYHPVAVMHFASYTSVSESVADPLRYYTNNVDGTSVLLRAVLDHKPVPFIFSSSAAVYGLPKKVPVSEDSLLAPINPYGANKVAVERMLADMGAAKSMPWAALRSFNAAGADPEGEIGQNHNPETHLIPQVIRAALNGTPVSIFGDNYDTPDGTCIRDYVHVMDIADAHVLALKHLLGGGKSGPFNLASARGHSVKEVIAAASPICGHPIAVKLAARRPGDPAALVGSAERARAVLGWMPARPDLELQIRDAWNSFKSR
jgi:UDP-arabinose 4-epimerase